MTPSALHLARFDPVGMAVLFDSILSADAASFDVQNVPAGYRHLLMELSVRSDRASNVFDTVVLRCNGDSGANYFWQLNYSFGSTASGAESLTDTGIRIGDSAAATSPSGIYSTITAYIADYSSGNKKIVLSTVANIRDTTTTNLFTESVAGLWNDSSAINRLTLLPGAGSNFKAGSRLTIYGLGGAPIAEVAGIDGWTTDPATWTYASASTFTVTGDQTAKFSKGTRIKLTQTTTKYFVVVGSVFSSGTTTVTITGGSDYSLANAAITTPFYSYQANPQGWPQYFNYTPIWSSDTTQPTIGNGTRSGLFQVVGDIVFARATLTPGSTSTFGTGIYALGLPVPYAGLVNGMGDLIDTGVKEYSAICRAGITTSDVAFQPPSGAGGTLQYWGPTTPWTFGDGDVAQFAVSYTMG